MAISSNNNETYILKNVTYSSVPDVHSGTTLAGVTAYNKNTSTITINSADNGVKTYGAANLKESGVWKNASGKALNINGSITTLALASGLTIDGNDYEGITKITGSGAIDVITATSTQTVDGGANNDKITGGASISGGAGVDTLIGGAKMTGGAGNDIFMAGDAKSVEITDYAVGDTISLASGDAITSFAVNNNDLTFTLNTSTSAKTIKVTNGVGKRISVAGADQIYSRMYGSKVTVTNADKDNFDLSDDTTAATIDASGRTTAINVTGGSATTLIKGGTKDDTITGSATTTLINSGAGNDVISGATSLTSGAGNDTLVVGNEDSQVITDYTATDKIQVTGAPVFVGVSGKNNVNYTFKDSETNNTFTVNNASGKVLTFIDSEGNTYATQSRMYGPTVTLAKTDAVTAANNTLELTDDSTVTIVNAAAYTVAGGLTINAGANTTQITGASKVANEIYVQSKVATKVTGGDAADFIAAENVTLASAAISGGKGNDFIRAAGGKITGGAGTDTLAPAFDNNGGNLTFSDYSAADSDVIVVDSNWAAGAKASVSGANVVFTNGTDTLTVKGNQRITFMVSEADEGTSTLNTHTYTTLSRVYGATVNLTNADASVLRADSDTAIKTINAAERTDALTIYANANANTITLGSATTRQAATVITSKAGGKDIINNYHEGDKIVIDTDTITSVASVNKKVGTSTQTNVTFTFDNKNTLTLNDVGGKQITFVDSEGNTYTTLSRQYGTSIELTADNLTTQNFANDTSLVTIKATYNTTTANPTAVTDAISITGNKLANSIVAGAAGGTFDGVSGKNTLVGGSGVDTFIYNGNETIVNYTSADKIQIDDNATITSVAYGKGNAASDLTFSISTQTGTKSNGAPIIGKGTLTLKDVSTKTGVSVTFIGTSGQTLTTISQLYGLKAVGVAEGGSVDITNNSFVTGVYALNTNTAIDGITATGNAAANTLEGSNADDVLNGGAGNDVLFGGTNGADTLTGGEGADTLLGGLVGKFDGLGKGSLVGGSATYTTAHSVTFKYNLGDGNDVIYGYNDGSKYSEAADLIQLGEGVSINTSKGVNGITISKDDAVLNLTGKDSKGKTVASTITIKDGHTQKINVQTYNTTTITSMRAISNNELYVEANETNVDATAAAITYVDAATFTSYSTDSTGVTINANAKTQTILGSEGGDSITSGSAGTKIIVGNGGDDTYSWTGGSITINDYAAPTYNSSTSTWEGGDLINLNAIELAEGAEYGEASITGSSISRDKKSIVLNVAYQAYDENDKVINSTKKSGTITIKGETDMSAVPIAITTDENGTATYQAYGLESVTVTDDNVDNANFSTNFAVKNITVKTTDAIEHSGAVGNKNNNVIDARTVSTIVDVTELFGEAGNDTIYASTETGVTSFINGGLGNDVLYGTADQTGEQTYTSATFNYENGDGNDVINKFNFENDTIQLTNVNVTGAAVDRNGNVSLTVGKGKITVNNAQNKKIAVQTYNEETEDTETTKQVYGATSIVVENGDGNVDTSGNTTVKQIVVDNSFIGETYDGNDETTYSTQTNIVGNKQANTIVGASNIVSTSEDEYGYGEVSVTGGAGNDAFVFRGRDMVINDLGGSNVREADQIVLADGWQIVRVTEGSANPAAGATYDEEKDTYSAYAGTDIQLTVATYNTTTATDGDPRIAIGGSASLIEQAENNTNIQLATITIVNGKGKTINFGQTEWDSAFNTGTKIHDTYSQVMTADNEVSLPAATKGTYSATANILKVDASATTGALTIKTMRDGTETDTEDGDGAATYTAIGGKGANLIIGSDGSDILQAGTKGNDTLQSGNGTDQLIGNSAANISDTFYITGGGEKTITNYTLGKDSIRLAEGAAITGLTASNANSLTLTYSLVNDTYNTTGSLNITTNNGTDATLNKITVVTELGEVETTVNRKPATVMLTETTAQAYGVDTITAIDNDFKGSLYINGAATYNSTTVKAIDASKRSAANPVDAVGGLVTTQILGSKGNDTLSNGTAANIELTGGAGVDTFVVNGGSYNTLVTITDYGTGASGNKVETIKLVGLDVTANQLANTYSTVVSFDGKNVNFSFATGEDDDGNTTYTTLTVVDGKDKQIVFTQVDSEFGTTATINSATYNNPDEWLILKTDKTNPAKFDATSENTQTKIINAEAFAKASTIQAGENTSVIFGGTGADKIYGYSTTTDFSGSLYVEGGKGNDLIVGTGTEDVFDGGDGNDTLQASSKANGTTFTGGAGNDVFYINSIGDGSEEEATSYGLTITDYNQSGTKNEADAIRLGSGIFVKGVSRGTYNTQTTGAITLSLGSTDNTNVTMSVQIDGVVATDGTVSKLSFVDENLGAKNNTYAVAFGSTEMTIVNADGNTIKAANNTTAVDISGERDSKTKRTSALTLFAPDGTESKAVTVKGGTGTNVIYAGAYNSVVGGAKADTIYGADNTTIAGGAGNDVFVVNEDVMSEEGTTIWLSDYSNAKGNQDVIQLGDGIAVASAGTTSGDKYAGTYHVTFQNTYNTNLYTGVLFTDSNTKVAITDADGNTSRLQYFVATANIDDTDGTIFDTSISENITGVNASGRKKAIELRLGNHETGVTLGSAADIVYTNVNFNTSDPYDGVNRSPNQPLSDLQVSLGGGKDELIYQGGNVTILDYTAKQDEITMDEGFYIDLANYTRGEGNDSDNIIFNTYVAKSDTSGKIVEDQSAAAAEIDYAGDTDSWTEAGTVVVKNGYGKAITINEFDGTATSDTYRDPDTYYLTDANAKRFSDSALDASKISVIDASERKAAITITASKVANVIGGSGADSINVSESSSWSNVTPGKGNDTVVANNSQTDYNYNSGDGADVIVVDADTSGNGYTTGLSIHLSTGVKVTKSQRTNGTKASDTGSDLLLTVTKGSILVKGLYSGYDAALVQVSEDGEADTKTYGPGGADARLAGFVEETNELLADNNCAAGNSLDSIMDSGTSAAVSTDNLYNTNVDATAISQVTASVINKKNK